MSITELITVFGFIAAIAAVYAAEFFMLGDFALAKLRGRAMRYNPYAKTAIFAHVLAIIGLGCFIWGYLFEPYMITVSRITIHTDKLAHDSLRIVHITDLHCDVRPGPEELLVETVNELQADIVVFTGDAVNSPEAIDLFRQTLSAMEAHIGKFAVRGNWDRDYDAELLYEGTGFKLLENRIVSVEKGRAVIDLLGVDYFKPEGTWQLLRHSHPDNFRVFLFHSPDLVESISNIGIDLYLAGHTHGGQVALPGYGALVTMSRYGKRYESGLYRLQDTVLYVNRGIGMESKFPLRARFFSPPEVAVFDIVPTP